MRAPVKYTSQNSRSWFSISIGRTSMPGWSIGQSRNVMPAVTSRRRVGAGEQEDPRRIAGQRRPDLLAVDHPLVAVGHRPGRQRGQVGTGVGLRVALAPAVGARQDPREEPASLLLRAPAQQRVADHLDPEVVVRRAGRHPGTGELLGQHDLLAAWSGHHRRTPGATRSRGTRDRGGSAATRRGPSLASPASCTCSARNARTRSRNSSSLTFPTYRAPSNASALSRMILRWSAAGSGDRSLAKSAGVASPSACG